MHPGRYQGEVFGSQVGLELMEAVIQPRLIAVERARCERFVINMEVILANGA